jgi:poly(A) polymerase
MTIPRVLSRPEHPISRGYIDPDALRVLYRLHRAGFKAYLVGGSVRDLMTGRTPKDFDIGTDARPQEIRRLFRNSRVIGRRFRLAHIFFEGGKIVEVSTFRRTPDPAAAESGAVRGGSAEAADQQPDEDLLIRSDNTFGTPEEDAVRRDFTINGLFYDIATYAVLDYVGGVDDLERRVVRTIGEPVIRFREDPVRMMRACEFAARLDFTMAPDLIAAIAEVRKELRKSAAPRVTEELLEPLRRGWGSGAYRLWSLTGLLDVLLPELDGLVGVNAPPSPVKVVFWKMLADADERCAAGEKLEDAVLLGTLFLPLVIAAVRGRGREGARVDPAQILLVLENVVNPLALRMSLPNLAVHLVKQGLYTMGRLAETRPEDPGARRLVPKAYFPTAAALLSLYAKASGRYLEAARAWRDVLARAGSRGAPFPEALVPPPALMGKADVPGFPAPAGAPAGRGKRRRRSGRRHVRHVAAAPAV